MQTEDNAYIERYYNELVEKYGDSYKSCDYGNKDSQIKKFKVLLGVFDQKAISVLDVGCGTGDFYCYLKEKFNYINYEGIDLSEKMVALCKSKYGEKLFKQKNLLDYKHKKDFIVANGVFYLIRTNPEKNMQILINYMFSLCCKGVAFNSLSSWATKKEEKEFYADPIKILEFCSTLTQKVVLRHDYLPHDFTIYMYK